MKNTFAPMHYSFGLILSVGLLHCGPSGSADGGDVIVPVDIPSANSDVGADGAAASLAGAACTDNSMCGPNLQCNTELSSPGFCTKMCTQGVPSREEEACGGPGSTCSVTGMYTTNPFSSCTARCTPNRMVTGCRPGFVCTGFYDTQSDGTADIAGCVPFCVNDASCPAGKRCNPRTGRCGATGVNMALLADGSICTPPAAGQPDPCRGECLPVTGVPGLGLCASYLNLALTQTCPDTPERITVQQVRNSDDRGACAILSCSDAACCPVNTLCFPNTEGPTGAQCLPAVQVQALDGGVERTIRCGGGDGGVDGGRDSGVTVDASADGG